MINLFPFKFDKCAPLSPPKNEPKIKINKMFKGKDPILLRAIAPAAFQNIPTVRKVMLIELRKSKPKVWINKIVTNRPVPEEIEPFKIPIINAKELNLRYVNGLIFFWTCLLYTSPSPRD